MRTFLMVAPVAAALACGGQTHPPPTKPCVETSGGPGFDPPYCLIDKDTLRAPGATKLQAGQAMLVQKDDNTAALVVRDDGGLYALGAICRPACCVVNLCQDAGCDPAERSPIEMCGASVPVLLARHGPAFLCVCDGSQYRADGSVLSGPSMSELPSIDLFVEGDDVIVDLGTPVPSTKRG
jgi:Rieske Fe-S protein